MKIVAISDTHGKHNDLVLPEGDMIIHAGDVSMRGMDLEINAFLQWFSSLDYQYKIFIAGNHDFYFEHTTPQSVAALLPVNMYYLENSGVSIDGIHFWGSPITPWFHDWAFNRLRGPQIRKYWEHIPLETNVLITHGPVYGIQDKTARGYNVGCEDLLEWCEKITPQWHICGHIHEAYGQYSNDNTTFINASVVDLQYNVSNAPFVFEILNS